MLSVTTCSGRIPNGRVVKSATCHFRAEATCAFECDDGFEASSTKPLTCGYDHLWTSPAGELNTLCKVKSTQFLIKRNH